MSIYFVLGGKRDSLTTVHRKLEMFRVPGMPGGLLITLVREEQPKEGYIEDYLALPRTRHV